MSKQFKYDVFISHSSKDKPAVRGLAERLRKDGLCVWLDEWEIKPGDMISLKIEEGLEQSRTLVLVMSASAFASEWVTLERHTAMFRDPSNQQRRFIPLRIDNAKIPDSLKLFAYVDWQTQDDQQYTRLVGACQPLSSESTSTPSHRQGDKASQVKIFEGKRGPVLGVAVTLDGQRAVAGYAEWFPGTGYSAGAWDLVSGKTMFDLKGGHSDSVQGVSITATGDMAISSSADGTMRIWSLSTGMCMSTLRESTGSVYDVALTKDGRFAVSGSADRTVRLWDTNSGKCIATLKGHTDRVFGIAITPDGRFAVSGSADKVVRIWDLLTRKCIAVLEGHSDRVLGVAVTPNWQKAVSVSADKSVRIWDISKVLPIVQTKNQLI